MSLDLAKLDKVKKPNTPKQTVVPVEQAEQITIRKKLDDFSKEPAVNFTTSLPLSLRDKLKEKAQAEKVNVKDLIISALLNTYEDLK